jgi:DNA-binding LacI/PurR family transcriptional regulator
MAPMHHPPPTLRDVARHAGCSLGTVSGVLSGKGSHAPAMVARVMEAVRATGFVPRRGGGRPLNPGLQVALLFPEDGHPGSARSTLLGRHLTRGAEEFLASERHHLLLAEARGELPPLLAGGQADGVILRAANYPQALLEGLGPLPSVWAFGIHPPPPHMDLVSVDNVRLGIMAAELLAAEGVESVRILRRDDEDNLEVLLRILSLEHALRQPGIASRQSPVGSAAGPGTRRGGRTSRPSGAG